MPLSIPAPILKDIFLTIYFLDQVLKQKYIDHKENIQRASYSQWRNRTHILDNE